ncbi:MAG: T9SS type A sorting domain-containing protein [candidate division WOR-3 bacterium]|nr:MAG: T9SS type A sorting domain-containing protein [candidate division WOR-3 bacterium]
MYFDQCIIYGYTGVEEQRGFSSKPFFIKIEPTVTRQSFNVHFTIQETTNTTVTIYNSAGLRQKDVFSGILQKGPYSLTVTTSDLPVGVYFLALRTSGDCERAKFIVAR